MSIIAKNRKFLIDVRKFSTSKSNIICIKIPDSSTDPKLINLDTGCKLAYGNFGNCFNINISKTNLNAEIIGFSHNLSESEKLSICQDEKEFYQVFGRNDIMYNYSAFTGKWVVVKVLSRLAS